jgi:hypothetical protein
MAHYCPLRACRYNFVIRSRRDTATHGHCMKTPVYLDLDPATSKLVCTAYQREPEPDPTERGKTPQE